MDLEPGDYSVYEIQPTALLDGKEIAGTGAVCTVAKNAFLNLSLNPGVNATGFNFTEGPEDTSLRPFSLPVRMLDKPRLWLCRRWVLEV